MNQVRWVTPTFAVAGQLSPDDLARAAAEGVKLVINNRPDGEEFGQSKAADMQAAAASLGLRYESVPFSGPPPPHAVARMAELLENAPGPVLAYCRSGRRSIMGWALAQALAGARRPDELIALAAKAGYDLEGARGALETLAPRT